MNFQNAEFLTSYGLASQIPVFDDRSYVEIAFAGRSNVGKSSAINKLFSRKSLARVSSVPGKTATINFYRCGNKNGAEEKIRFVDLPGYGFAKTAKTEIKRWSELIDGYFSQDRNIRLVVSLIDMRHPPTELDLQMINFLQHSQIPFIVVMTKCDKLNKTQTENRLLQIEKELPEVPRERLLQFSSETGKGVGELKAFIEAAVDQNTVETAEPESEDIV